ncbi:sulfurtransferase TusA family protein [Halobacillus sp. BAB-2008]|uniref:sulfurtransferase TusA family protein n=1 Tax=Halobacillus sp. BAB-2008 TaxID=1246484 RepID=UPI0002A5072A|nr:sulfurtransferase TusA family protein [Halobacillus sp. BAB-2008]ELK45787.1 tusA/rhodanese domain protein [Halobacillus sp. BAB-2008]
MTIKTNQTLDAKGLACPMPIVKTKKAFKDLAAGDVLEVLATDKGSKADLQAWAKSSGHDYLGIIEDGDVLKHYLRKTSGEEAQEKKHPHIVDNETLQEVRSQEVTILDVREQAEFAFTHIPGAVSIPLGELDARMNEIDSTKPVYVICRTGSRSDLAAQKLADKGLENVYNVVPGMREWNGETSSINN